MSKLLVLMLLLSSQPIAAARPKLCFISYPITSYVPEEIYPGGVYEWSEADARVNKWAAHTYFLLASNGRKATGGGYIHLLQGVLEYAAEGRPVPVSGTLHESASGYRTIGLSGVLYQRAQGPIGPRGALPFWQLQEVIELAPGATLGLNVRGNSTINSQVVTPEHPDRYFDDYGIAVAESVPCSR